MHEELFSQLLYMARQSDITITEVVGDENDFNDVLSQTSGRTLRVGDTLRKT